MELNVVYTLAYGLITRIEGFLTRRMPSKPPGFRSRALTFALAAPL